MGLRRSSFLQMGATHRLWLAAAAIIVVWAVVGRALA
jgi:hypothetical protein